jgi:hypothetical protein
MAAGMPATTGLGMGAVAGPAVLGPTLHSTESCEPWYL